MVPPALGEEKEMNVFGGAVPDKRLGDQDA